MNLKTKIFCTNETILYVEDNEDVRYFTKNALISLGYKVIEAADGKQALDSINGRKNQIDLLITDVVMPEMGGKELSDTLRKLIPSLKTLFTSGYTSAHIVQNGELELGIHFVQKPYTLQTLSQKIRSLLDEK